MPLLSYHGKFSKLDLYTDRQSEAVMGLPCQASSREPFARGESPNPSCNACINEILLCHSTRVQVCNDEREDGIDALQHKLQLRWILVVRLDPFHALWGRSRRSILATWSAGLIQRVGVMREVQNHTFLDKTRISCFPAATRPSITSWPRSN